MKRFIYSAAALLVLVLVSCNHDDDDLLPYGDLKFQVDHSIDNEKLHWDSLMYLNAANELFSLSDLKYYLGSFRLYKEKQLIYTADTVIYVDARNTGMAIQLKNVPAGSYDSVSFYIGVDPLNNVHGRLPATAENIAMEWPDIMGGGYHFLKLEGHWKDGLQTPGFAVHLGTDPFLVTAGAKASIVVTGGITTTYGMNMNINEWLRQPFTYSFSADGGYTMGNMALMQKISANGKDVFRITP